MVTLQLTEDELQSLIKKLEGDDLSGYDRINLHSVFLKSRKVFFSPKEQNMDKFFDLERKFSNGN